MRRVISTLLLAMVLSGGPGCQTTAEPSVRGLPPDAQLVGQGRGFVYVAPANGRMYSVRDGKVVTLRIVSQGERFMAIGPVDWADPDQRFEDFKFYFEPSPQKEFEVPEYLR